MNWQTGLILVVTLACVVPGLIALFTPRKPRRFVQRDHVAARHRAIVRNGFKTRAGIR